jgi:hypothetical protein
MVVAPDLNQGADLVRAFGNGETRFKFTGHARHPLAKGVCAAGLPPRRAARRLQHVQHGLRGRGSHGLGADLTDTSAIQPPRSLHVGVRVSF